MPEEPDDFPQPLPPDDEATQLMTPPTGGGPILPASAPRHEVIGDYEVLGKLGAGGMGAVYRARQISLGRTVALKVLPHQFMEDAESVARFQREARVAASLNHANLVRVYAAGEAEGSQFIAMELIEGEDLGVRLKREKKFPAPEALRICLEVARGLEHVWRTAHLVHRDIKPGNIFLAENGEVKVGDLGLAKSLGGETTGLTQTGTMMGTPHYLSPEQARGDREIDFRSDIYSLGCTLYHLLTGQTPYGGTEAISIIRQHLDAPLPAILKVWPQCPIPLARLVGKMLKKHRNERQANYGELIAQMETVWAQIDPQSYHPEAFAPPPPADPDVTLMAASVGATVDDHPTASPTPSDRPRPSRPSTPTKSRVSLYGGTAAGMAALAIVAYLAWPKEEKLTKAEIYARDQAAAQAVAVSDPGPASVRPATTSATVASTNPALPNASAGDDGWQRLFTDPAQAQSFKSGKYTVHDGVLVLESLGLLAPQLAADAAIRARIQIKSDMNFPALILRGQPPSYYRVGIARDLKGLSMTRWDADGSKGIGFGRISPPEEGQTVEMEFRCVGPELTAFFNGQKVITVTDSVLREPGSYGITSDGSGWFERVEGRSLALPPAGAATSEPWQNVLRDPAKLVLADGVERTPEGLRFTATGAGPMMLPPGQGPQRDGAVRMRATFGGVRLGPRIRSSGAGWYSLHVTDATMICFTRADKGKGPTNLGNFPMRERLKVGQDYELELRVVGQTFTAKFNGEIIGTATDATFLEGQFGVSTVERIGPPALVKSLEVLDLDTPAAAGASGASPTTATATKDAPFVNTLGMKFVPVPITGGPTDGKRVLFSIWETRVQDYRPFVQESGRGWSQLSFMREPAYPAVMVSWEDAQLFCAWLTSRERQAGRIGPQDVYRLPTDHEWSCAVGIGDREDAAVLPREKHGQLTNVFPWGEQWPPPPGVGNFSDLSRKEKAPFPGTGYVEGYDDGEPRVARAMSYPSNSLGLYDLAGNVREWCEDWDDASQTKRTLRGSSWHNAWRQDLGSAGRSGYTPSSRQEYIGFRVVLAPER